MLPAQGWSCPQPIYAWPTSTTHPDTTGKSLPASVITAGILMLLYAVLFFLIVTVSLVVNPDSSPLWLSIVTYLSAVLVLAAPIFMLQRKRWAYSMSFSVLTALFIGIVLDAIGMIGNTIAVLQFSTLPFIMVVVLVVGAIVGIPMALLSTKSARRAFEGERDPSAVVWAGGGYQLPWEVPFAMHPSDTYYRASPASQVWALPPAPRWGAFGGLGYLPIQQGLPQYSGYQAARLNSS